MSGDWIKMRVDLYDDPAVIQIARRCAIDEYGVVGRLHRLWSWADRHTVDGNAVSVTPEWIDRYVGCDKFAIAMISARWLVDEGDHVTFPNFERHNGESAKKRALTNKRVAEHRELQRAMQAAGNAISNAASVTKSVTREEKRRSKEKTPPNPLFDRFWAAYPNKDSKARAARAFANLNPSEQLVGEMISAIQRAVTSDKWREDGGRYIPHGSTWINDRRWEDEGAKVANPQRVGQVRLAGGFVA